MIKMFEVGDKVFTHLSERNRSNYGRSNSLKGTLAATILGRSIKRVNYRIQTSKTGSILYVSHKSVVRRIQKKTSLRDLADRFNSH